MQLRRTIQQCCGKDDFMTAYSTYEQMHLKDGVPMEAQSFYNLLNLCGGLSSSHDRIHIGTPKTTQDSTNSTNAAATNTTLPDNNITTMTTSTTTKEQYAQSNDNDTKQNITINDSTNSTNSTNNSNEDNTKPTPTQTLTFQQRKEYAYKIKSQMDERKLQLNETGYTAILRLLSQTKDFNEAESLLQQAEKHVSKPKLRMYSCLLMAYCADGNLLGALRIWSRMILKQQSMVKILGIESLILTEREYCSIMQCAIQVGDGPVMERILKDLAVDVLVPSFETTSTIIQWFESKHAIVTTTDTEGNDRESALNQVSLPECHSPSLVPIQYESTDSTLVDEPSASSSSSSIKWNVSNGVTIDTETGNLTSGCMKGMKMQPFTFEIDAWREMLEMNETIVTKGETQEHAQMSQYAGGGKGKKKFAGEKALKRRVYKWQEFIRFLERTVGPSIATTNIEDQSSSTSRKSYDFVIDGANVGYYKQNFANAPKHVDYRRIDRVMNDLIQEGKTVLLVMHERHFVRKMMPSWAYSIVNKWDKQGLLYRTPAGSNDDWFWMHAALWSGDGTLVLSNDEMRDHHFQMMAHRLFLKWKERHLVRYDWDGETRKIKLFYPDVYTRCIQRLDEYSLVIPLPKRGDENRFLDGCHEAGNSVPVEETYACMQLSK